jgi:hypothetical protein
MTCVYQCDTPRKIYLIVTENYTTALAVIQHVAKVHITEKITVVQLGMFLVCYGARRIIYYVHKAMPLDATK